MRIFYLTGILLAFGAGVLISAPLTEKETLDKAKTYIDARMFDDAKDLLLEFMADHPASADLYLYLGVSYLKKFEQLNPGMRTITKFFSTSNVDKALEYFDKSLEFDPDRMETLFYQGVAYSMDGRYPEALLYLEEVKKRDDQYIDPFFGNVWFQLGEVYRGVKNFDKALEAYQLGAVIDVEDSWPIYQLSFVYMELDKPGEASEAYYAGLNSIDDPLNLEKIYYEIIDVMSKSEQTQWDRLSGNAEKGLFIKGFWKKRDPNPTDLVNERLIEHYRRLYHVRTHFAAAEKRGYDDRGAIYLRLGEPDDRFMGISKGIGASDNESWSYESLKKNLCYDFVSVGGIFRTVPSLLEAVSGESHIEGLIDMYEERSYISPYYTRVAIKLRGVKDGQTLGILNQNEGGGSQINPGELAAASNRINVAANLILQNQLGLDLTTVQYQMEDKEVFNYNYGAPHLPVNFNVASFRSEKKGFSRFEFYVVTPFSLLNFTPAITGDMLKSTISLKLVIYDDEYSELESFSKDYNLTASSQNDVELFSFLEQIDMDLKPGKYVMAFEIRNNQNEKVGIYKFSVYTRDYNTDSLTISDIEIAKSVEPVLTKERFIKPNTNLNVIPNPAAAILKTKPLFIFYEIYGLTLNDNGKSRYEVSYKLKMLDTKKSFFGNLAGIFSKPEEISTTSSNIREGNSVTQYEYIAFDISDLPEGQAELEVLVKDLNSGHLTRSLKLMTVVKEVEQQKFADDGE